MIIKGEFLKEVFFTNSVKLFNPNCKIILFIPLERGHIDHIHRQTIMIIDPITNLTGLVLGLDKGDIIEVYLKINGFDELIFFKRSGEIIDFSDLNIVKLPSNIKNFS